MPGFISLVKFNQKGMADVKKLPDQIKQTKDMCEKLGVRLVGVWLTVGAYDAVAVFDAPNDQTMATLLLTQGMQGTMATETMRAFSEDEIAQIVKKLS